MVSITKTVFRTALIGGLAVGGLTLVVGPQRMCAGFAQVRHHLVSFVDDNVADPILIRQQLQKLRKDYPAKIRDVRGSIAEIDSEIAALERDHLVATKVIERAHADHTALASLVDKANVVLVANNDLRPVRVKFRGNLLTVDQAYSVAGRIRKTAISFNDRLASDERDLELLSTQRARLVEQLDKLQTEYANFEAQAWQVERQIAQIERNKKYIDMMEDHDDALAGNDRFHAKNLQQIIDRLAAVQAENEAIIESLNTVTGYADYEREVLDEALLEDNVFDWSFNVEPPREPLPQMPLVIDENTPLTSQPGSMALLDSKGSN